MHDLIGERPAARHDADAARAADIARDDADFGARRGDESGAVRADEAGAALVHVGQHARHVQHRNPLGDAHDQRDPGIGRLENGGRGDDGRNVNDRRVGPRLRHRVGHGVEHGYDAVEHLAAFSRRDPGDHLGAVSEHLPRVERAVPTGDPLHHEARLLVDEDAHAALALVTACLTASSMSVRAEKPALVRIAIASSSFVPVRRITSGTLSGNCAVACTMPFATSSPRVMPPKILKRMARTLGSAVMIRSALTTFCGSELPPMSRKFAGSPPYYLTRSV